jgi:hypothetical protein
MKNARPIGQVALAVLICSTLAYASDPAALYARVDKVVLEPSAESPQAIQVWGVFALAKPGDRNEYLAPVRGYLYFTLPRGSQSAAQAEWADLKAVAGSGLIVSFGSRYEFNARLRAADERPANPDPYSLNVGLTKVRGRTEYPPIRALIAFRD